MASITKRGIKWQAQARREGHPLLTRTFASKAGAAIWARQTETRLDNPVPGGDLRVLDRITLGDLLRRYREEQTPQRRRKRTLRPSAGLHAPFLRDDGLRGPQLEIDQQREVTERTLGVFGHLDFRE